MTKSKNDTRQAQRFCGLSQLSTMPVTSSDEDPLGIIEDATIIVENETVRWVGPGAEEPQQYADIPTVDLGGRVALPGLVDCHTHVVYGGDRLEDFGRRTRGMTYEEILAAGGGIHTTVNHTRALDEQEMADAARPRLQRMLAKGITTVEIKSGYGLSHTHELRMLRSIQRLKSQVPQRLVSTFLGAHVVPKEVSDPAEYVDTIITKMLPDIQAEKLADFVDVFCESGAFDVDSCRRILESARDMGFGLKLHAEQLGWTGGTHLGAELKATSVDHVDHASDEDLAALAAAGTVAVLLPSATLYLGGQSFPRAERFRKAGVSMALATDCNPGSSPTEDLGLVASLGCAVLGMTPEEALRGITVEAARALNLVGEVGSLVPGARADFIVLDEDVRDVREIPYRMGCDRISQIFVAGAPVH